MKPVFSKIALAATFATFAGASFAEEVCMPAAEMKASLIDWYSERPLTDPTETNEQVWVSDRTGTWTVVKYLADGNACAVAQGNDWMAGLDHNEIIASLAD